jgi:hypothetical protein
MARIIALGGGSPKTTTPVYHDRLGPLHSGFKVRVCPVLLLIVFPGDQR